MKIHHINCGCMRPAAAKLMPHVFPHTVVCHCMVIETSSRLIIVDTGLGRRDLANPHRLGLLGTFGIDRDPANTAYEKIKMLGFAPEDVTDLIPTHLDFDHAGGIEDFPQARVHVSAAEYGACYGGRAGFKEKVRYKSVRFSHDVKWRIYEEAAGTWNGFARGRDLEDLPSSITAVCLPGHSPGHHGIAVETSDGVLLHAGDAYYNRNELRKLPSQYGLTLFQKVAHTNYAVAMKTQEKLSQLENVRVFCAHDPVELKKLTST